MPRRRMMASKCLRLISPTEYKSRMRAASSRAAAEPAQLGEFLRQLGAVDEQRVARDEARLVGGEEERRAGDVPWRADATERNVFEKRLAHVRTVLLERRQGR